MIGASIYGFVDYKQTKKKKEFKDMYTEKKAVVPVVVSDAKTTEPDVKKETVRETKVRVTNKREEKEEIISGVKPIPVDQKLETTQADLSGVDEVTVVPAKENNIVKKKKRKFGIKEFSRAPLRDDIEEEVVTPVKKSSKKTWK